MGAMSCSEVTFGALCKTCRQVGLSTGVEAQTIWARHAKSNLTKSELTEDEQETIHTRTEVEKSKLSDALGLPRLSGDAQEVRADGRVLAGFDLAKALTAKPSLKESLLEPYLETWLDSKTKACISEYLREASRKRGADMRSEFVNFGEIFTGSGAPSDPSLESVKEVVWSKLMKYAAMGHDENLVRAVNQGHVDRRHVNKIVRKCYKRYMSDLPQPTGNSQVGAY